MDSDVCVEAKVGGRLLCEGHYGTIRYVGEVPPTQGAWLGVEWDDPSRGKHSGTHEEKHYFACSVEGSGSFLRPKKANFGTTFIQAVEERYKGGSGQMAGEEEEQLYVDVKPVEMIGWDQLAEKQSRLNELKEVSLREMLVSSAGPPSQIASTTPAIVRLDLSANQLLSSWETVQEIASQLKLLTTLQLSKNKHLHVPLQPLPLQASAFPSLRALFLNKMDLTWNKVSALLTFTPNLEELHVCENRIETLSEGSIPRNLQLLNLEENQIWDWKAVLSLKRLEKLKTLILNDNKLETLGGISHGDFLNVECLCLSGNNITQWSSVTSLAVWPALTDLKFKGNPLHQGESVFAMRQLLIARLEKLKSLNNSPIPDKERLLAERFYVKHYASEYLAASKEPESTTASLFHTAHPRYAHLVSGLDGRHAGMVMTAVKIKCPSDASKQELSKKLPLTMTVQKLKGLLQRLYKVDSQQQKLSYLDKQGSHEIELTDDLRQLSFYSMADGDTVLLRW